MSKDKAVVTLRGMVQHSHLLQVLRASKTRAWGSKADSCKEDLKMLASSQVPITPTRWFAIPLITITLSL
jgi:hypothetical protein